MHSDDIRRLMEASTPRKVEEFRLSSWLDVRGGDWNFKIRTDSGVYFIESCESTGSIDSVWSFLDALCRDEEEASWITDQEGPDAILVAKKIDQENMRLLLFSCGWWEFTKQVPYKNLNWDKLELKFDLVIKRSRLIAAIWAELVNGFSGGDWKFCGEHSGFAGGKMGSSEVGRYFGARTKDPALDEKLIDLIRFGTVEQIEGCLKQGANPNALYRPKDFLYGTPLSLISGLNSSAYRFLYTYSDDFSKKTAEQKKEIEERFATPKRQLDVIELLLKYGAEPNFFDNSHPWAVSTLEEAIRSRLDPVVIEFLLRHGAKDTNDCWKWTRKDAARFPDLGVVVDLLKKYGEETIYYEDIPPAAEAGASGGVGEKAG